MPSLPFYHDRIKEDLLREIGWVITNKVRDPRVPPVLTVTDIKLSADTRNATVHISVYGGESEKKSAHIALNRAAPFIQKCVAQRISLRHFPRLAFRLDDSIERGMRINSLLKEINDGLV